MPHQRVLDEGVQALDDGVGKFNVALLQKACPTRNPSRLTKIALSKPTARSADGST